MKKKNYFVQYEYMFIWLYLGVGVCWTIFFFGAVVLNIMVDGSYDKRYIIYSSKDSCRNKGSFSFKKGYSHIIQDFGNPILKQSILM